MTVRRTAARLLAAPAALGVALLGIAGPASAHVSVSASTTAAGAYSVLTVSVPHGCDGAATTKVVISVPESILAVTPTRNPLWTVTKGIEKLDAPITDAHGNSVTERDATVTYVAKTPLPDGFRDAFELSVKLPDEEGATLVFPTVQTCEKDETAWIEVPTDGQDGEELEHPAPSIVLTAAEGDGHGATVAAAHEAEEADTDEDGNGLEVAGLATGVAGLLTGGAALTMVRRKQ